MPIDAHLIDWVSEAMAPIGTVTHRAMMGGATLYLDGTVFAIIAGEGHLWFKADKVSDAIWDDAGCERFTFDMNGKTGSMNYRRAPDDVHDDVEAMQHWAAIAVEAGRRAPPKKPKKPKVKKTLEV
jgi:DNA transformation protein and related proteins